MSDFSVKISGYSTGDKIGLQNDPQNRSATIVNRHEPSTIKENSYSMLKNVIVDIDNDGRYTKGTDKMLLVKLPEPTAEELKPTKREKVGAQVAGVVAGASSGIFAGGVGLGIALGLAKPGSGAKVALMVGAGAAIGGFILARNAFTSESALAETASKRAINTISDKVPNFVSPKE